MATPATSTSWRDEAAYMPLLQVDAAGLAWEWLRRDPAYRRAAGGRFEPRGPRNSVRSSNPEAAPFGLHAFEDPGLPAPLARPAWRSDHWPALRAAALVPAFGADAFDISRCHSLATLLSGAEGAEHLLLSDGYAALRIDVVHGTLLRGPVLLELRIPGLRALEGELARLRQLGDLARHGRFTRRPGVPRQARHVALLRVRDALAAGARQRDIAFHLLGASNLPPRWRTEDPSLRLRAQRLVRSARAMAAGGWTSLLPGRSRSALADHHLLGAAERAGLPLAQETC